MNISETVKEIQNHPQTNTFFYKWIIPIPLLLATLFFWKGPILETIHTAFHEITKMPYENHSVNVDSLLAAGVDSSRVFNMVYTPPTQSVPKWDLKIGRIKDIINLFGLFITAILVPVYGLFRLAPKNADK